MARITKQALTQLTAPSQATEWVEVGELQPASIDVEVTVASINTNVVTKTQYSDDAVNLGNAKSIAAEGDPKTITSSMGPVNTGNGVYNKTASPRYKYMREYFVSESGGTSATIDTSIATFTN